MELNNHCPCCGRECDLSEPRCWRGEEYARTGQIPEHGGREDRGHGDRGREDRGREDQGREDRGREDRGREDRVREDRGREDRGREDRGREDRGREDRGRGDRGRGDGRHGDRGHGPHDHRDGCRRPDKPRKSILDSDRYEAMDMDEKLTALLREMGNWLRFHMEDKGSQNRILRILAEEGPMTQKDLTERIGIQPGSASEVLGKLEKSDLITRTPSEADRRTVDVALTETGKEQALRQSQITKERRAAMFEVFTAEEKQVLLASLETLSRDWKSKVKQNSDNQEEISN